MHVTFEIIILCYLAVLLSSFVIFIVWFLFLRSYGVFRKTIIILCFRNIFFFFAFCFVFAMLSPEQNAQMNYCHY